MNVSRELNDYLRSCYGDRPLSAEQRKQVSQAFLSGVHALNESLPNPRRSLRKQLRNMLMRLGAFPTEGN